MPPRTAPLLLCVLLACRERADAPGRADAPPRAAPTLAAPRWNEILRPSTARDLLLADIAHHERRWQAERPARYELLLETASFGRTRRARITIDGTRVVAIDSSAWRTYPGEAQRVEWRTVEGLFNRLRWTALHADGVYAVEYHPTIGYPRHIRFDPAEPRVRDAWGEVRVLELHTRASAAP